MRDDSDHITELNNTKPKQPFFFLKPASSILIPGAGPVLRPKGVSLHYEVELGLVMGKTVRDLDPEDKQGALDAIQSGFALPLLLSPFSLEKGNLLISSPRLI